MRRASLLYMRGAASRYFCVAHSLAWSFLKMISLATIVLLVFASSHLAFAERICAMCASTSLRNRWFLTRLPVLPTRMEFEDGCLFKVDHSTVTCGTSTCMEMLLTLENELAVVRGCYKDFFEQQPIVTPTNSCTYTIESDKGVVYLNSSGMPNTKGYSVDAITALDFCTGEVNSETTYCNDRFAAHVMVNDWTKAFDACTRVDKTLTCLECDSKTEKCDKQTSKTCRGVYCGKYEGTLDGASVTQRMCMSVNPYLNDTCLSMKSVSEGFGSLINSLSRQRRSTVNYTNEGISCVCNTDYCNGSPLLVFSSSLLVLLLLIAALS